MTNDKDQELMHRLLYPNPFEEDVSTPFSVDQEGIPILDEVVQPEDEVAQAEGEGPSPADATFPLESQDQGKLDYEALLSTMRVYLKSQLEADMEGIISDVVPQVVSQASRGLEETLRQELQSRLEAHASEVIEKLLEQQLHVKLFS